MIAAADPAFVYLPSGRLSPIDGLDDLPAWRHLSAQVARDRLDLESQVRRVLLACRPALRDRLFGALLDLFLALDTRGVELRRQVLDQCGEHLEAEDEQFLRRHLERGLSADVPLPAGSAALLDPSISGARHLVAFQRRSVSESQGPLAEAIERLENGDLEGARTLLEAAVLREPGDEALARELQGIYHHSRDDAGRQAMVQRFQDELGHVPMLWQA
ncbi:hypothetical protein C7444_11553 [Sphaerotilus hippei]|uniref:Tetratricopeptide repeat protein n=1 Tax=Sphaerotilus hippei TaxID=744406 RepID=A0A318GX04_9BURK|nr:hypothetical protein [Sphaerotilus hippei]PXW94159.1 hypothetical protein C7444_11553 [Sphaerotilus hippei]